METEWSTSKAACNEKKHQLTFDEALEVFDDPFYIEKYDGVHSSCNEERYIVLGRVKRQVVVVVVHTPRNGKSRIISARYAHRKKGRYTMTTSDREAIIAECESNAVPWDEIDFSQIPEITDFSGFYPGRQGVSEKNATQECVSVQFNKVLLDHLRSKGMGWQAELNNFLMSAYKKGLI